MHGFTKEGSDILVSAMAKGKEALGSMGVDTPLAALSLQPRMPSHYFKQLFAQVKRCRSNLETKFLKQNREEKNRHKTIDKTMGVDTPLAALSLQPRMPSHYFKQLFAQVQYCMNLVDYDHLKQTPKAQNPNTKRCTLTEVMLW